MQRVHSHVARYCLPAVLSLALAANPAPADGQWAVRGDRNDDGILYGHSNILGANDDGFTGPHNIGFELNFFGTNYSQLWVNNNGNVTFNSGLSTFTPFALTTETNRPIIAPFFADVDTRGVAPTIEAETGRTLTPGLVSFASYTAGEPFTTAFDGRAVFSVTWNDVGFYSANRSLTNTFQLNLIERFDTGLGNFDIEFNYDNVDWETGSASGGSGGLGGTSARVGFSSGSGASGTFSELQGSGVNGALLDGGVNALADHSLNSAVNGRYVFQIRNSELGTPGSSQGVPLLPTVFNPGDPANGIPPTFIFNNAVSGAWFDPPDTEGYDFQITSPGSLFTSMVLPTGINAPGSLFSVFAGGSFLGDFAGGSLVDFGAGVDAFRITGINPLVDSTNPNAFPTQLYFNNASGNDFTMTPLLASPTSTVPEPGTVALLGTGLAGMALLGRRRRRKRENV